MSKIRERTMDAPVTTADETELCQKEDVLALASELGKLLASQIDSNGRASTGGDERKRSLRLTITPGDQVK